MHERFSILLFLLFFSIFYCCVCPCAIFDGVRRCVTCVHCTVDRMVDRPKPNSKEKHDSFRFFCVWLKPINECPIPWPESVLRPTNIRSNAAFTKTRKKLHKTKSTNILWAASVFGLDAERPRIFKRRFSSIIPE